MCSPEHFALIQKLRTAPGHLYPVLSERSDIIVMTDEAHRCQYADFATNMHRALENRVPEMQFANPNFNEELTALLDQAALDPDQERRLEREFARISQERLHALDASEAQKPMQRVRPSQGAVRLFLTHPRSAAIHGGCYPNTHSRPAPIGPNDGIVNRTHLLISH